MKNVIFVAGLCLVLATPVQAQHHHRNNHWGHKHHHRHAPVIVHKQHNDWVFPLVGGVILGAVIADANAKEKEKEEKVIIQTLPSRVVCSEWKEIITEDGRIYRERYCSEGR